MAAETETLQARTRTAVGSAACARLREEGLVPAVLYGHGEDAVSLQVPYDDLDTILRHHGHVIELALDQGKTQPALLKEVQHDALGSTILHVDFLRVSLDEQIELEVPIELKGALKGEHAILQQMLDMAPIQCLPTAIPAAIVLSIANMEIGDTRHASDLKVPQGVTLMADPDTVVVTVTEARAAEVEEEAELAEAAPGAEEPEVIGREEDQEGPDEDKASE